MGSALGQVVRRDIPPSPIAKTPSKGCVNLMLASSVGSVLFCLGLLRQAMGHADNAPSHPTAPFPKEDGLVTQRTLN